MANFLEMSPRFLMKSRSRRSMAVPKRGLMAIPVPGRLPQAGGTDGASEFDERLAGHVHSPCARKWINNGDAGISSLPPNGAVEF